MKYKKTTYRFLQENINEILENPDRSKLVNDSLKYAIHLRKGPLATWHRSHSTGRSPNDTYIVKRSESQGKIDWTSRYSNPMSQKTFDMIFNDALNTLAGKKMYTLGRVIGADPSYALKVLTITNNPLTGLFVDNMFRPVQEKIERSTFSGNEFVLLCLPYEQLDPTKYEGRLRKIENGKTSPRAIVMDLQQRIGIVYGSAYLGTVKKLMFTVMNFYLPDYNVLPVHCSANVNDYEEISLFLGLSGTGKTTLSSNPNSRLIGDDEHGWSNEGVFNLEYGCYAKIHNLDPIKEKELYTAIFNSTANPGVTIENLLVFPWGDFDLADTRLTENARASFPLAFLSNAKEDSVSKHPKCIFFLSADAYGVIPPISRLNPKQALFWFLMGYTSKLAGTETGILEPEVTFSRFFGEPFMLRKPKDYTTLFQDKMEKHHVHAY